MDTLNKKIFIVIPAFNEATHIASVINDLKSAGYNNILVVNDGSKDKTEQVARETGIEVLNHIINRGQGAALRTGIEYLHENYDPDVILTFDADGQHQVEDIDKFIRAIIEDRYDIAVGSRFLEIKSNVAPLRKIILKAGVLFTNILSGTNLTDTHNGFRALGKKAIKSVKISHRGMEHASDIIDEITRNNLHYKELPVRIVYSDYSKIKGQKSSAFIKMGLKILLKKLTQ